MNINYMLISKKDGNLVKLSSKLSEVSNTKLIPKKESEIHIEINGKVTSKLGYDDVEKVFRKFEKCYGEFRAGCNTVGVFSTGYCDECDERYNVSKTVAKILGSNKRDESKLSLEYEEYIYNDHEIE